MTHYSTRINLFIQHPQDISSKAFPTQVWQSRTAFKCLQKDYRLDTSYQICTHKITKNAHTNAHKILKNAHTNAHKITQNKTKNHTKITQNKHKNHTKITQKLEIIVTCRNIQGLYQGVSMRSRR